MIKKYLNLETVSQLYDVNLKTLRYMCLIGQLPASKFGGRWYVKAGEIQKLFEVGENSEAQQRLDTSDINEGNVKSYMKNEG